MRNLGARPGLLGPGRELCWSVMFPKMGAGGIGRESTGAFGSWGRLPTVLPTTRRGGTGLAELRLGSLWGKPQRSQTAPEGS